MNENDSSTHFGFQTVPKEQKAGLVAEVFSSVASRYDIMNDVMSMGAHRAWKHFTASQSGLRPGDKVLDIAAGSADMSRRFHRQVGPQGQVVVTDINAAMLAEGKRRMVDNNCVGNVQYMLCDAEQLCFEDNYFNTACIAFGLRNVTDKARALKEMRRVIKPAGRLLVLEFSKPIDERFAKFYDKYSFNVIPKMGELITGDRDSYQYLVESIRQHPDQETLKGMMQEAGFARVKVHNMALGAVALHIAYKD